MSSARESILSDIRNNLSGRSDESERERAVADRLENRPRGIIPKRGQLKADDRVKLFADMAEKVHASVKRVSSYEDIPKEVSSYLRGQNLPASVIMGEDKRLKKSKWASQKSLTVEYGPTDGNDLVGVSHATAGIAETGSLLLESGQSNPTTINFLADYHIVVISAKDIKGDMETTWAKLKKSGNDTIMPRAVNFITGPSRSGDIEQKLLLGAHGPRALHVIIVG